ncbi:MAG: DUF1775 domain-containing protein [Candidatus Nanopelagicaceae bacterium]
MKKKITAVFAAFALALIPSVANAHVGIQMKGYTLVAGQSSRLWLSLGHGCQYKGLRYGTSVFQVVVPATAGKPTPEFHYGFKTKVVASSEKLADGITPAAYTVTWTATTRSHAIDDGTFYDFGLKVKWDNTPQKINFPTTQICYAGKTPLYLKWEITDGSTKAATEDTEFGPSPSVTTIKG